MVDEATGFGESQESQAQQVQQEVPASQAAAPIEIDSSSEALGEQIPSIVPIESNDGVPCFLNSVEVKKDDAGRDVIDFTFVQVSGKGEITNSTRIRFYDPSPNTLKLSQEELTTNIKREIARIKHIAHAYIEKDQLEFRAPSFMAWVQQAVQKLGTAYLKVPINVKFVYNNKGYVGLPLFPPFVSSEKRPTKFEINKRYDNFVKSSDGSSAMDSAPGSDVQSQAANAFG